MRETLTDFLDVLGLLLVVAGVMGGAWLYIGPWSLCLGGGMVLGGSWYATRGEPEPKSDGL